MPADRDHAGSNTASSANSARPANRCVSRILRTMPFVFSALAKMIEDQPADSMRLNRERGEGWGGGYQSVNTPPTANREL
jgi:hypothetical protein